MNGRLQLIYSLIHSEKGVIDVGTDHGYIPVELAKNNYTGNIIASDINTSPLNAARHSAKIANVENQIKFLISDGLADCDPDSVDTIIIAGMGGDLICTILDNAEWCLNSRYSLILQPMTKKEILRYWLTNNGFGEISDYIVKENGKIFHVISAKYNGNNIRYSDGQLFTGKIKTDASFDHDLYIEMIRIESDRIEKIYSGLRKCEGNKESVALYKTILDEIKDTRL